MPYITQEEREELKVWLLPFINDGAAKNLSAGQVNYLITTLVKNWIGDPSYTKIATMTGVVPGLPPYQ